MYDDGSPIGAPLARMNRNGRIAFAAEPPATVKPWSQHDSSDFAHEHFNCSVPKRAHDHDSARVPPAEPTLPTYDESHSGSMPPPPYDADRKVAEAPDARDLEKGAPQDDGQAEEPKCGAGGWFARLVILLLIAGAVYDIFFAEPGHCTCPGAC